MLLRVFSEVRKGAFYTELEHEAHLKAESPGKERVHGFILLLPLPHQDLLHHAEDEGMGKRRQSFYHSTEREEENHPSSSSSSSCTLECFVCKRVMKSNLRLEGSLCNSPFTYRNRFLEATWSWGTGRISRSRPKSDSWGRHGRTSGHVYERTS